MTTDADIWTPGGEVGPAGPAGPTGPEGPSIELQATDTWVQWRVVGAATWNNLILVSDLIGPRGNPGPAGTRGPVGPEGRHLELRSSATHLQWRLEGNSNWNNLVTLASLQGPEGEGNRIFSGPDFPEDTLGDDGDYYIWEAAPSDEPFETDVQLLGPKIAGTWSGPGVSLRGPTGERSDRVILYGNGAPAGSVGTINDFYIDLDTYDLYGPKTTGGWGDGVSLLSSIHSQYGVLQITGNTTAFSLTAASDSTLYDTADYTQITGIFEAVPHGPNNGVTQGAESLTFTKGGTYKIEFWASISSNANNTRVAIAYAINGSIVTLRRPVTTISTASDVRAISSHGLIEVTADDVLTIWLVSDTTADITIPNGVISVNELVGAGTVESLDDLDDVDLTTAAPTDAQVLTYDNATGTWIPATPASGGATTLDGLTDVDLTTTAPTDGQILVYVAADDEWVPADNTHADTTARATADDAQTLLWLGI